MTTRTVCIIQARLSSQRLPGKVLMDIEGRPMLQRVVDRARMIPGADQVIIGIPHDEPELLEWCMRRGIPVAIGSPDDVLDRYWTIARGEKADVVMRITGDCPLLDPAQGWQVLAKVRAGADLADNLGPMTDGTDVEAFKRALLDAAHDRAFTAYDREHVTPYMRNQPWIRHERVGVPGPAVKLSVDTMEDLERARAVCRLVGDDTSWAAAVAAHEAITARG